MNDTLPETLTITITDPEKKELKGEELLMHVKADIAAFEQWFQKKDGPLHPIEEALLTTYLGWKLGAVER